MTAVKIENRLVNSYRNTISEWAWVSGMEISSSRGLKMTLKLVRGKEKFFFPRANFWRFFEMKKFPYLKLGPFRNPIFS